METQQTNDAWLIFTEDRDAVLDGLRQGKCDAILPAATHRWPSFYAHLPPAVRLRRKLHGAGPILGHEYSASDACNL